MPLRILSAGLPKEVERFIDYHIGLYKATIEEAIDRRDEMDLRRLARDFVIDLLRDLERLENISRPLYEKMYSNREKAFDYLQEKLIDLLHDKELLERMEFGLTDPIYEFLVHTVNKLLEDTGYKYIGIVTAL